MSSCMCVDRAVRSELVDFKTDVLVCQTVAEPVRLECKHDLSRIRRLAGTSVTVVCTKRDLDDVVLAFLQIDVTCFLCGT